MKKKKSRYRCSVNIWKLLVFSSKKKNFNFNILLCSIILVLFWSNILCNFIFLLLTGGWPNNYIGCCQTKAGTDTANAEWRTRRSDPLRTCYSEKWWVILYLLITIYSNSNYNRLILFIHILCTSRYAFLITLYYLIMAIYQAVPNYSLLAKYYDWLNLWLFYLDLWWYSEIILNFHYYL